MNTTKSFTLPAELSSIWNLIKIISFTKDVAICKVQNTETKIDYILKIYASHIFSKRKKEALSNITDSHFLLPKAHHHIHHREYVFYPLEESLKEILYDTGLSFHDLLCLGTHMIDAISILCDTGIYEADISPCNIYRNSRGIFCLGDINLEKCTILGTHPYVAPEYTHPLTDEHAFKAAMQYSICSLLYSICKLQKDFLFDEMQDILSRGMAKNPSDRFASLTELKRALASLSSHEKTQKLSNLLLHRENHPLFYTKTMPVPKNGHSFIQYFVSIFLMLSIIFFIISLQRYHAVYMTAAKSNEYIAVLDTSDPSANPVTVTTGATISKETATLENTTFTEIDLQHQNNNSFSDTIENAMKKLSSPSDITCIYAGNNYFKNLDGISSFNNLRELYLNDNKLTDLSAISDCNKLKTLVLSYNKIRNLSSLSSLTALEYLDISSNKNIKNISVLYRLTHLKTLNISNTNVSQKEYRQLIKKLPVRLFINNSFYDPLLNVIPCNISDNLFHRCHCCITILICCFQIFYSIF